VKRPLCILCYVIKDCNVISQFLLHRARLAITYVCKLDSARLTAGDLLIVFVDS